MTSPDGGTHPAFEVVDVVQRAGEQQRVEALGELRRPFREPRINAAGFGGRNRILAGVDSGHLEPALR